jgi:hypothetical protein
MPLLKYNRIYSSKVFTYTPMDKYLPHGAKRGGIGYDFQRKITLGETVLTDSIEHTCPDYSLYGLGYSMGFLTRGCDRKCDHCVVPSKEGSLRGHADIEEFARHRDVVLLDNNVLASKHGIQQIEKIIRLGLKVDFNQGLDARLIDDPMARLLSKVKWLVPLRLSCDSQGMMKHIQKAVELLRWHNTTPSMYKCYVLVKDVDVAVRRVKFLKGLYLDPFAQPFRDMEGTEPTRKQREFARWVDRRELFKSVTWEDYWDSRKAKT